jgi:hypothetical protein
LDQRLKSPRLKLLFLWPSAGEHGKGKRHHRHCYSVSANNRECAGKKDKPILQWLWKFGIWIASFASSIHNVCCNALHLTQHKRENDNTVSIIWGLSCLFLRLYCHKCQPISGTIMLTVLFDRATRMCSH